MLLILFCDVMMAAAADEQRDDLVDFSDDPADVTVNYALTASDAPGLAILDSGCTRTMHGSKWSSAVEDALKKYMGWSGKPRPSFSASARPFLTL